MKRLLALGIFGSFLFLSLTLSAQVPKLMDYHGKLTDAAGNPITTATMVRFSIYQGGNTSTAGSGTLVYEEDATVTPDSNGEFSHLIGGGTFISGSLDITVFNTMQTVFLEITVDPAGMNFTLLPRKQIVTVGYSFKSELSENADTVDGKDSEDFVHTEGDDMTGTLSVTTGATYALYGVNTATSGTNYGVYGTSLSSSGRGVYGYASTITGINYGVYGDTLSADGYAGYFDGDARVTGDLIVDGTIISAGVKPCVQSIDDGKKVLLYAMESPEYWFEDFGTAQLVNGRAVVQLENVFAQTVNTGMGYYVFLTPTGNCKGLYISRQDRDSFEVRELGGGTSSISFYYRIVAKRRGYEDIRFEEFTEPNKSPEEAKLPIERKAATVKQPKRQ